MADIQRKTLVVDEGGTGDYRTLTDAVAACADTPNEPVRFYLKHGIYEERPFIELADYIIEGEYRTATVLTASVGGRDPWPGESKTGTFRSETLFLGGGRAVVRNLTVQNNAGDGAKAGQALAVYSDASRVLMENVNLYGNQDTRCLPLPCPCRSASRTASAAHGRTRPGWTPCSTTKTARSAATSTLSLAVQTLCSTPAALSRGITLAASAISRLPARPQASPATCL